jgi:superfamily I DNA and RNA helicase
MHDTDSQFALSVIFFDDEHMRNVSAEIISGIASDESIDEAIGSQALTQQVLRSNRAIESIADCKSR